MFNLYGIYGNIHIKGKSIDVEKTSLEKLKEYLKDLEEKNDILVEEQNEYLSHILSK